jgi:hypothetical protein
MINMYEYWKDTPSSNEGGCTVVAIGCSVILLLAGLFGFIEAWIVNALWDWIMIPHFNWPDLTIWETWGFMILINFLFSGLKAAAKTVSSK